MTKIAIKNFGPIKDVEIDLKKVNVFIGPQSSGKSTIAKVISFFRWVEKRYILDGEFKYKFSDQFINFHRIGSSYFYKDTFIKYESDFTEISYNGMDHENIEIQKKHGESYKLSKNIYIPSERNFVSVIPNLGKYNETKDNIMSFLYDWFDAKSKYSKKNPLSILNLNASYYYSQDSEDDFLTINNNQKDVSLKSASSGLQSIVPLTILIDYLTGSFFSEKKSPSVDESKELGKLLLDNINYILGTERVVEFEKSVGTNNAEKAPFSFTN
jgi:predicted ATP-dependent endonuclease of OLD family